MNIIDRLMGLFVLLSPALAGLMLLGSAIAQDGLPELSPDSVQQRFESANAPISVVAEIVATESQIAVPIDYRVTIDAPPGATVVLPPIAGVSINQTGNLRVVDKPFADFLLTGIDVTRDVPLDSENGTRRTQLVLEIESLKSGTCRTPAIEVVYRLADSETSDPKYESEGTVSVPALGLDIGSVLAADDTPEKFRDIKPALATPVDASEKNSPMMGFLFVGMGALFIAFLWWLRCNKRPKPEGWALQRVAELQRAYQSSSVTNAEVYGELSIILREYIQAACNTPATALCTAEVLDVLQRDGFNAEVVSGGHAILSAADVSKFAPASGALAADETSPFEQARAVIHESVRLKDLARQQPPRPGSAVVHSAVGTARKVEV